MEYTERLFSVQRKLTRCIFTATLGNSKLLSAEEPCKVLHCVGQFNFFRSFQFVFQTTQGVAFTSCDAGRLKVVAKRVEHSCGASLFLKKQF
jgi:hypothetical protein